MTPEQISARCRKWFQEQLDATGMKPADVVKEAKARGLKKVSKQNISRVMKNVPSEAGTPPTFSREAIVNLAKVFNSSESEALAVIGAMSDDASGAELVGKKAADLIVKLPTDRQSEALDYLQHMVKRYATKKATKKFEAEDAPPRSRKSVKR